MKKFVLFSISLPIIVTIISASSLLSKSAILAFPGQCCNSDEDCNNYPNEACSGGFSYDCYNQGYRNMNNTCVSYTPPPPVATPTPHSGLYCCVNDENCRPYGMVCSEHTQYCDTQISSGNYNNTCGTPVATLAPTPPSGQYCCANDEHCSRYGMVCSGYSQGCVGQYFGGNPNFNTCQPDTTTTITPPQKPVAFAASCTGNYGEGVQTALGCIPTDPMNLVKWLFPYLLGFGGLAAFGLIVYSGFQLMTSSGDPQKIQGAKETITSAVTGLIFIILSLFLLRLIGVDILGLPGLE